MKQHRNRKFNPKKLFTTLLYLVTGTNNEGYRIAIDKCFDAFGEFFSMPTKGALTQLRNKISYRFFEDQFNSIKNDFKKMQRKFKGLTVYSIDGDIYSLCRNKNTEEAGFYGCPVRGEKETHFLRMYTVSAVDVFSGIPVEFAYGTRCKEIELALSLIGKLEENSLCIYDRLYFSKKLVNKHKERNNYFLCRLQKNSIQEANYLYRNQDQRSSTAFYEGVKIRCKLGDNPVMDFFL